MFKIFFEKGTIFHTVTGVLCTTVRTYRYSYKMKTEMLLLASNGLSLSEALIWPLQQNNQPLRPMPSGEVGLPSIGFPSHLYNTLKAGYTSSIKPKNRKKDQGSASNRHPILSISKTTPKPSVIFFPTNENEGCAEANTVGRLSYTVRQESTETVIYLKFVNAGSGFNTFGFLAMMLAAFNAMSLVASNSNSNRNNNNNNNNNK